MTVTTTKRDESVAKVFVELAGSIVGDFDVTDLLQRLVEHTIRLLGADAVGLLLSDQRGNLQVMASSNETTHLLELFQLQSREGPCLDAFNSGEQVMVPDLEDSGNRWPTFVPAAETSGFRGVHAVPLRAHGEIIGAMNIFSVGPRTLTEEERHLAQALADAATIAILQERIIQHNHMVIEQLQGALNSRVVIEQAKGVLASAAGLDMDGAFNHLRQIARSRNRRLSEVARDVVEGRMVVQRLTAPGEEEPASHPDAGTA